MLYFISVGKRFVHDQAGTGARREIARDAPPQFEQLSQKMGQ